MKIRLIPIMLIALISASSCKKSFFDINADPNFPVDVPAKTLLPTTTVGIATANSNELGKVSALLMQYNASSFAGSLSYYYDQWNVSQLDNQWNNEIYGWSLVNLNILIDKTKDASPAYSGIAKLQKAYLISLSTDLFGDVPYSQAGQGTLISQPVFDAQQDIYFGNTAKGITSLFDLVRSGLADLTKASNSKPGADDIVYGGNLTKWTRVGNSLLLKFALQVSNVAPDTTKAVINSILSNSAPYIDDVNGTLDFNVPFSAANPNPYFLQDFGGSIPNTEMLSNRFLALMRNQNDTVRLSKFYTKPTGTFVGWDNGSPFTPPVQATRSVYGNYVVGTNGSAPVRLITAFRNFFILAEAALIFGTPGDANTYYQNGIKASMLSTGMTAAEVTAYFAANPTLVTLAGTTGQKRSQIITQKYIASVGNAIESYNDYRRTGLPVLAPPLTTSGDDPATFPKRFPYVSSEATANPNQPNPRPLTNVKVWWGL